MSKLLGGLLKVERTFVVGMQTSLKSTQAPKEWKKRYIRFRKPPWAPLAVTKLHRVSQGADQEGEAYEKMKERYNHFRTIRKSLYHYFKLENEKEFKIKMNDGGDLDEGVDVRRMEEVRRINDEWNLSIQNDRGALDAGEVVKVEEELEEVMKGLVGKGVEREEGAQARILQAMEQRQGFITEASSLDEAIEASLNLLTNHNYCIDLHGNKYHENTDGSLQGSPNVTGGGGFSGGGEVGEDGGEVGGGKVGEDGDVGEVSVGEDVGAVSGSVGEDGKGDNKI